MEEYTISQIAKMVGVNKETIRYYEKFGLLPLPERKSNGAVALIISAQLIFVQKNKSQILRI